MMEDADLEYIRKKRDEWWDRSKELHAKARSMDDYPWSDESILRAVYRREADMASNAATDLSFIYAHFSGEEFILIA